MRSAAKRKVIMSGDGSESNQMKNPLEKNIAKFVIGLVMMLVGGLLIEKTHLWVVPVILMFFGFLLTMVGLCEIS